MRHVLGALLLVVVSFIVAVITTGEIQGLASVGLVAGQVLLLGHAVRISWIMLKGLLL